MFRKAVFAFVLGGTVLATVATAGAQSGSACRADMDKLCSGVEPGKGRMVRCMKEHEKELSPECKKAIEARRKNAQDTCKADQAKYCANVTGPQKILNCLAKHEADLSRSCQKTVQRRQEMLRKRKAQKGTKA